MQRLRLVVLWENLPLRHMHWGELLGERGSSGHTSDIGWGVWGAVVIRLPCQPRIHSSRGVWHLRPTEASRAVM